MQCTTSSTISRLRHSALIAGPFRRAARNAFPFVVVGAVWEAVAHLGLFPAQFFPSA